MEYEIKEIKGVWTVMGYRWDDPFKEEPSKPNYELILVGMNGSLDSVESIITEVYRETYDMTQITDVKLAYGDTFRISPTTVKTWAGKFKIPEQIFTWDGHFHLEWTKGRPENYR